VYRVALNTALSWRRKDGRKPRTESIVRFTEKEVPAEHQPGLEDREALQQVYRCICQLPKIDCALALLCLNGLKYTEMGEILGLSPENVGVRLNRIKKALADMMKGLGHDEL